MIQSTNGRYESNRTGSNKFGSEWRRDWELEAAVLGFGYDCLVEQ